MAALTAMSTSLAPQLATSVMISAVHGFSVEKRSAVLTHSPLMKALVFGIVG